ncbi:MAG: ubiquinol-cytochrome c reductase iron-sulfur subunit [Candidatus Binatia bacterium]
MPDERDPKKPAGEGVGRRDFLSRTTSLAMAGGLAAGYGTFAAIAGRYLYPARPEETGWLFVTDVAGMKVGDSMAFRTPTGATAAIARRSDTGSVADFIALSSTCPHLGCQVHWEGQNNRFFCPCHNGTFDPSGMAISGPPAEAGQSLPRYPLKIENGLLYVEAPLEQLARDDGPADPDTGTA